MKKFDVKAPVREYQDNQGQKKTHWSGCAHMIATTEQAAHAISANIKDIFIVVDAIPVSPTWDGRCAIFEPQQAPAQPQYQQPQYQQPQYQQPQPQPQYQQPAPQAQYPQQQPKQYRDDLPF